MGKYDEERGNPGIAACSGVSLLFDSSELKLTHARGTDAWPACSGKPVGGTFHYSVDRQKIRGEGPIPEGRYWVDLSQMDDNWHYSAAEAIGSIFSDDFRPNAAWGRFRLTIHPYPATETYGRGGFFIHGGDEAGSAGCIDLVKHMTWFVVKLHRLGLYDGYSGGKRCHVPLRVSYPSELGDFPEQSATQRVG